MSELTELPGNTALLGLMVLQGTEAHQVCRDPMDHRECEGLRDLRERGENLASLARWDPPDQLGCKVLLDPSASGESGESLALSDLRDLPASEVERETRDLLETRASREYQDLLDLRAQLVKLVHWGRQETAVREE